MSKNLRQRVAKLAKARGIYESVPPDVLARRQAHLIEGLRWCRTPVDKRPPRPPPLDPADVDQEALRAGEKLRAAMRARASGL